MDDDDFSQLGLDLDSPIKRTAPTKGRRAGRKQHPSPSKTSEKGSPISGILASPEIHAPNPPPRSRRTGGWADDAPAQPRTNTFLEKNESISQDDSDNDIPVIPDLEDIREEDLAYQISQAPSIPVHRVATYQELDTDLMKHAAFATLDGIDLRPLSRFLAPKDEIAEDDIAWTWDILFTDVASALNAEWDKTENKTLV